MSTSSKLERLITDLKLQKIDISKVKNPEKLIQSLKDLNTMIGHKKIKDSIAEQTRFLIGMLGKPEQQDFMLNTVIYGPPGIGKTTIGVHLSRIWNSLGYLKNPKIQISIPSITQVLSGNNSGNDIERVEILTYFLLGSYIVGSIIYLSGKKVFEKYGFKYLFVFSVIVLALVLALSLYVYNYIKTPETKIVTQQVVNSDPIKIVSRADFVSEYLGQTAIKTNNLLKENIGKVLFIDEAYSLYEGREDPYGIEALTALNKFLSEHPKEIIVIFAGYKEAMKNTIFKVQQGLSRRCMWVFTCEPYTHEELFLIFKQQIEKSGWKLKDEEHIKQLFKENFQLFKNYGGDTERLCNFAKIKHFDNNKRGYLLDFEDVQKGLLKLSENHA